MSKSEFDSVDFEKRLTNLKDTQDSIQSMSAWCLQNRNFHKKIVSSWLNVLKQVKVEHRLTLFHLANDVIQYSKRKNYEFVESWGTTLQKATTMVRDEKVKHKIERILQIWESRGIYNEEFLADLHGLLSINPAKKPPPPDNDDEQAAITMASIRNCVRLEKETDKCFKQLSKVPLCDTEALNAFKDRQHVEDVEGEVNDHRAKLEMYIKVLTSEIRARTSLITVLDQSDAFYHNQRGEVKVVANAYRNFGNRIKTMKRKLEELAKSLPSPIPSPDINAPSPGPDNDLVLPGEKDFDQVSFGKQSNGFMGYMDRGSLPFDISDFGRLSPKRNEAHTIQVIGARAAGYNPADPQPVPPVASTSGQNYLGYNNDYSSQDQNSYNQYNPYAPGQNPSRSSIYGGPQTNSYNPTSQSNIYNPAAPSSQYTTSQSAPTYNSQIPLAPPPLPPAFDQSNVSDEYNPDSWEMDMTWNTSQESSFNQSIETPHSPPHFERKSVNTNLIEYIDPAVDEVNPTHDVDHRQLLLPMGALSALGKLGKRPVDVDHRNLISLTGSPKTDKDTITAVLGGNGDAQRNKWPKDMDFRQPMMNVPPPPLPPNFNNSLSSKDVTLEPPPSPPAMLMESADQKSMQPPITSKIKISPTKGIKPNNRLQNGRDNTESIDMEMSDEDFDGLSDHHDPTKNELANDGDRIDDENNKFDSPLQPPPNLFNSPPMNFADNDNNGNASDLDVSLRVNQFLQNQDLSKGLPNPFTKSNANPNEMLQQLQQQQQQMLLQQQRMGMVRPPNQVRPLMDLPTGFNSPRPNPFLHQELSPMQMAGTSNAFMMGGPGPRPAPQFMPHNQPISFRGASPILRGNSPYYRNQKGNGPPGRGGGGSAGGGGGNGGFRNNFRGVRGNW